MLLIYSILLVLITACLAIPGAEKCSWGPDYWCQSLTQSKECRSNQYCLERQWNLPTKNDDKYCEICKQVFDKIIDFTEKNEDQIKPMLHALCNFCTTPKDCNEMIDENWEDIMNLINEELNSQVLCSSLNMCQNVNEPVADYQLKLIAGLADYQPFLNPENQEVASKPSKASKVSDKNDHIVFTPAVKTEKICNDCVQFLVDLKQVAEQSDKLEKLVDTIKQICDEVEMRSLCRLLLNKKTIKIIIDEVNVVKVCQDCDICTQDDHPVEPPVGDTCSDCNTMVTEIKTMSIEDFDKFEGLVRHSCTLLPPLVKDMCLKMAHQFAAEAENSLNNLSTKDACSEITLCGSVPKKSENESFRVKYGWPVEGEESTSEVESTEESTEVSIKYKYCEYCETAVEYIQYAVDSDMSSDEIKMGLKSLCNSLAQDSLVKMCQNFVDEYYDILINDLDMILNDPDKVCSKLRFCPKKLNFFQKV